MAQATNLIITVRRKSAIWRFWRELWALIQWGLQKRIYLESDAPFGVLGHESFSVGWRNLSDEIELVFFEHSSLVNSNAHVRMREEMRKALIAVAKSRGYEGVYFRRCKSTLFA